LNIFEEFNKNGNEKNCRKVKNHIQSTIENCYQSLLDDLSNIYSTNDYTKLNSNIKKFNRYA
jgi:vacuolar-type H+-ATPase subunit E/Vma4